MATFTPSPWRHRRRRRGSIIEVVPRAGVVRTGDEMILVRISDAFGPEQDILNLSFVANGRERTFAFSMYTSRFYPSWPFC